MVTASLLYLPFVANPIVFDDHAFFPFRDGIPSFHPIGPRALPYASLAWPYEWSGADLRWLRVQSLVLHIGVGLVLYRFLETLLCRLDGGRAAVAGQAAAIAALLFVLNPVAVYGAGYLIQRTILLATFFSVLTYWTFWWGLEQKSRGWLWLSAVACMLSVLSKEHAVMVPAVSACLWLLHRRSGLDTPSMLIVLPPLLAQGASSAYVVFWVKGVIGAVYEPNAAEFAGDVLSLPEGSAWLLSVLTQAGLFFKYLALWVVPDVSAMSIDMREPFLMDRSLPAAWFGLAVFAIFGLTAAGALMRGGTVGLFGLAGLAPWLLFATEFSSVRLQELFVLYRSYLWTPLLFLAVAIALSRLGARIRLAAGALLAVTFFVFATDRLRDFSHPLVLWNVAAKVAERNVGLPGVTGIERIYFHRGIAWRDEGHLLEAIMDFNRTIEMGTKLKVRVLIERGVTRLQLNDPEEALKDFEAAIVAMPPALWPQFPRAFGGSAAALRKLGRKDEAAFAAATACALGLKSACDAAAENSSSHKPRPNGQP